MKNQKTCDIKNRTFEYSSDIIDLLSKLKQNYIFLTLGKRLLRSATSVGANIIETQTSAKQKRFCPLL